MEAMELYRRLAALERRVNELEAGMQEIDRVVDPQGWIGEAFHLLQKHLGISYGRLGANAGLLCGVRVNSFLCKGQSADSSSFLQAL